MPTPWYYLHHSSQMMYYILDHEQYLPFSIFFSTHRSSACSGFYLSFFDSNFETLHLVDFDINPLTVPPGRCSWSGQLLSECFFLFQGENSSVIHRNYALWSARPLLSPSSPVHFFILRVYQIVDLATPNVFAVSLMDLFKFVSLMMVALLAETALWT